MRRAAHGICAGVLALTLGLVAVTAHAASVRVPADYFGMNFQRLANLAPAAQDTHLTRIAALGVSQVRLNASWAAIEPRAPVAGVHSYRWDSLDEQISAVARHRLRAQPVLTQTPNWDAVQGTWVQLQCAKSASRSPRDPRPYATFVSAFASRYGRHGAFWTAHPDLPYRPVVRYEIWNEPNLKGGWCPHPQPWLYADLFAQAAPAIRSVDPGAKVYTGGVAPPSAKNADKPKQYMGMAKFFQGVTARRGNLRALMSGANVHIYPGIDRQGQLDRLAWFRSQLHDGRIPNRIPMVINEIGWATHVGKVPVSESDRATAYARVAVNYSRTNCNVRGILAHAWISPEQNGSDPEDWYGIADPSTGQPYASALHFSYGVRLMRGRLSTQAPRRTLMACPGMPLPDSDRDAFPDERDYYPLNAQRH